MSAAADTCQIRKVRARAAYSIASRVLLTSSASAKYLAPVGPMSFPLTLQMGRDTTCQRLLTLWATEGTE